MGLLKVPLDDQEVFVSHANAALTPRARLRLARLIVDEGWPVAVAARRYDVAWPTAKRWADRYRAMGEAGMGDRSSRPHHVANRTPPFLVRKVVHLRWKKRMSPIAIGARLGMPADQGQCLPQLQIGAVGRRAPVLDERDFAVGKRARAVRRGKNGVRIRQRPRAQRC